MRDLAETLIKQGVTRTCNEDARWALFTSGLVGSRWQHYRNKHEYTIVGFSWNGDLDEWCIEYVRENCSIRFNRTFANSFGFIDGKNYRFSEVN